MVDKEEDKLECHNMALNGAACNDKTFYINKMQKCDYTRMNGKKVKCYKTNGLKTKKNEPFKFGDGAVQ